MPSKVLAVQVPSKVLAVQVSSEVPAVQVPSEVLVPSEVPAVHVPSEVPAVQVPSVHVPSEVLSEVPAAVRLAETTAGASWGPWVFGMIQRSTDELRLVHVERCDEAALLPTIIRQAAPGTRITTAKLRPPHGEPSGKEYEEHIRSM